MDDIPYNLLITFVFLAIIVGMVVNMTCFTPFFPRMDEGFYGGAKVDVPNCLRTLPGAADLLTLLSSRVSGYPSDGSADYKEFSLILSKLACLKTDLLSSKGVVDATLHQAFETAHDRVAVGELCGMCFNHTIGERDLDISFTTWRDRANVLLRKLCTEANLSEQQAVRAEKTFITLYNDVYHTATSKCLKKDMIQASKGDVSGFFPEHLVERRTYDYKYGGVSASGWNGAV